MPFAFVYLPGGFRVMGVLVGKHILLPVQRLEFLVHVYMYICIYMDSVCIDSKYPFWEGFLRFLGFNI